VFRAFVFRYGKTFADHRAPVSEKEMRAALVEVGGSDFGMHDVEWLTRLTDNSRQAEKYRQGRVFLVGDAAHVHFPSGGPGMNLGLQDAMNLGWKLGAAVNGWGSEKLLDSYQSERHPVGELVLRNTRLQVLLLDPDPRLRELRETFTELLQMPEVNRHLAELGTALDIRYDIPGQHPLVGRRMPDLRLETADSQLYLSEYLHRGRGLLAVLDQAGDASEATEVWKERVDVVVGRVPRPLAAALLVRPDGYVCWAGDPSGDFVGLRAALTTWFGIHPQMH
jgi:hypothetical protein